MAETVVVGSHGDSTSIVVNCYIAINLKKMGHDVALVFDSDALQAIGDRHFPLTEFDAKHLAEINENKKRINWPELDEMGWIKLVKESGIPIYTCGGQVELRGLAGKLPPEIEPLYPDAVKLLAEAKKVIGGW